jgi:hypothetical protein
MAQSVLVAAHSYTLVSPDGKQKTVVKRGQSIDNLDENDQQYLRSKSITPPVVDDSHPVIGRVPLFHPMVDDDVKGEATVEKLQVAPTPANPYAHQAPVQREQVTVSVASAAPAVEAPAAPPAPTAEAPAAPEVPPVPQAPRSRPAE